MAMDGIAIIRKLTIEREIERGFFTKQAEQRQPDE
jgi:hypothetical protein